MLVDSWNIKHKKKEINNLLLNLTVSSVNFIYILAGMRDARKLFRLLKSINEYQKLMEILRKRGGDDFDKICQIITRIGFLLYWY